MRTIPIFRIVFPLIATLAIFGQTPIQAPILKEGTDVKLKFSEDLSSKSASQDDPVTLILDEDIRVGDTVLVKAGAKAYATVSNAKKAGFMGKGGEPNIRLDYLKIDSQKVKLRGSKARTGEDKTGTAIALTVLLGPVGLIKHGKDIEIKAGTPLVAYVADDIILPTAK